MLSIRTRPLHVVERVPKPVAHNATPLTPYNPDILTTRTALINGKRQVPTGVPQGGAATSGSGSHQTGVVLPDEIGSSKRHEGHYNWWRRFEMR